MNETIKANLKISGHFKAEFFDLEGNLIERIEDHNIIPNVATYASAQALFPIIDRIDIGDVHTDFTVNSTSLGNLTYSRYINTDNSFVINNVLTFVAFFGSDVVGSVQEAGLHNSYFDVYFAFSNLLSFIKTDQTVLKITWIITIN